MYFSELSQNQLRVATDLRQTYEAYRSAKRTFEQYAGGMSWKTVKGHEYLIKILNRRGASKSCGPRSDQTEAIYAEFVAGKARSKERLTSLGTSVKQLASMAKSVGLGRVPEIVAGTLRRLADYGLLGKNIMVVGTNALYAYESAAGVMFDVGLLATTDVDLLWDARTKLKLALLDSSVQEAGVLAILQKVDRSFTAVSHKSFRAVNDKGFYVDLLKPMPHPPWKKGEPERIAQSDLYPSELPNIKWLLSSEKFSSIVLDYHGVPAPITVPDPRAFAVYKQWLSEQIDREPEKQSRDAEQAKAVIRLVSEKLRHLPLDDKALRMFPKLVRSLPGTPDFPF